MLFSCYEISSAGEFPQLANENLNSQGGSNDGVVSDESLLIHSPMLPFLLIFLLRYNLYGIHLKIISQWFMHRVWKHHHN